VNGPLKGANDVAEVKGHLRIKRCAARGVLGFGIRAWFGSGSISNNVQIEGRGLMQKEKRDGAKSGEDRYSWSGRGDSQHRHTRAHLCIEANLRAGVRGGSGEGTA
jgi:hypothetical protein